MAVVVGVVSMEKEEELKGLEALLLFETGASSGMGKGTMTMGVAAAGSTPSTSGTVREELASSHRHVRRRRLLFVSSLLPLETHALEHVGCTDSGVQGVSHVGLGSALASSESEGLACLFVCLCVEGRRRGKGRVQ